jgi:lipopolysaccharide exporter
MNRSGLLNKALNGIKWTTLSMLLNVSFNVLYTALMARLLLPASFGVMAMAQIAIRFVSYFAQLGVSPAIVQKATLSNIDIRAAMTISVVTNSLLVLIAWVFAPVVGDYFNNNEVVPVLRVLAFSLIISGFSIVSISILRRNLQFKKLAIIETISYIVGYGVVGMSSAISGMGVWSLVLAVLGQETLTLVVSFYLVRHSVRPIFKWSELTHFLRFGTQYSVIGFLEYLGSNLDSFLIGRLFSDTSLGIYNRAQMLVKLPMHHVSNTITKVLFPLMSAAQDNKVKIQNAYLSGWFLIGGLALSIGLCLIQTSTDVVHVLLGSKWEQAIGIIEIAALAIPFSFLTRLSGLVCDAQGLLKIKLAIQLATLLFLVLAIYKFMDDGMLGIAKAMVFTECFRLFLYVIYLQKTLAININTFVKINIVLTINALITLYAVRLTAQVLYDMKISVFLVLAFEVLVGGISFFICFMLSWLYLRNMTVFIAMKNKLPVIRSIERIFE